MEFECKYMKVGNRLLLAILCREPHWIMIKTVLTPLWYKVERQSQKSGIASHFSAFVLLSRLFFYKCSSYWVFPNLTNLMRISTVSNMQMNVKFARLWLGNFGICYKNPKEKLKFLKLDIPLRKTRRKQNMPSRNCVWSKLGQYVISI